MNVFVMSGRWSYKYPRSHEVVSFALIRSLMKTSNVSSIFPRHEIKLHANRAMILKKMSAPIFDLKRLMYLGGIWLYMSIFGLSKKPEKILGYFAELLTWDDMMKI